MCLQFGPPGQRGVLAPSLAELAAHSLAFELATIPYQEMVRPAPEMINNFKVAMLRYLVAVGVA